MESSNDRKLAIAGLAIIAVIVTAIMLYHVYTINNIEHAKSSKSDVYTKTRVYTIDSVGCIKSLDLDIYASPQSTVKLTHVDWGTISAGESVSMTLYAKNSKNTPFVMSLITSNWQPSIAEQYLTLQWTYTGQVINPNEMVSFDLILTVDVNIDNVDNFSFDITIKADEFKGGD